MSQFQDNLSYDVSVCKVERQIHYKFPELIGTTLECCHLKFMNFIEQLGLCDVFLMNLTTTYGGILLSLESNICQISIEYIDQTSIKYFWNNL